MNLLTLIFAFFTAAAVSLAASPLENSRPNIVLVITDDQGLGDLACMGNEVLNKPDMEMDARVEARRATKGNENKDRQSIINEIVGGDVKQLLLNGRDWRYEFRKGVSSLEDVLTAVREGLPKVPAEGEAM